MKTQIVTAMATCLGIGVAVFSCNRSLTDDPEPLEHRIEPCTQSCNSLMHPQCGRTELTESTPYDDVEGCIEHCATPTVGDSWAYQDDGTEMCQETKVALAACISSLSCEGQYAYWNRFELANGTVPEDYPCEAEADAQADCFSEYVAKPALEGGD